MSDALHILAITAHPDDAELLMGGVLAKAASEGKRTGVLDLAGGESGSKGNRETRANEAEAAAAILGLAVRENLELPDAALEANIENRLLVAGRIRVHRPEIVLIHRAAGRNPDHYAASTLAREAAYAAGLVTLAVGEKPHRPRRIFEAASFMNVMPGLVVDITHSFDTKLKAIMAYASQFDGAFEAGDILSNGRDDLFEQVTFRCRAYGALVQVPYGEPYNTDGPFLVNDPLDLNSRSL